MKESGERRGDSWGANEGVQSPRGRHVFPPPLSRIDDRDSEILSLARDRPITVLSISEKMDVSLVECLHRSGKLQQMGLLKRAEDLPDSDGFYLYIATEEAYDIVQRHAPNSSESGVGTP